MRKPYILDVGKKEAAKHGESFFPIQKYITTLAKDYPVVTTHWHEEAELTRITRGTCRYQINLVEYEVKEGDIIFVPPLLLHTIALDATDEVESETYVFHLNFLGANSTDICATRYLAPLMNQEIAVLCQITAEHPAYASLSTLFDRIAELYDHATAGYELGIKALLLQAVYVLLPYSHRTSSPDEGTLSDKLKNVLDHIETHYAEAITIAELARLCYFSEYHFMRFFKKHMGMTCVEYMNNLRLEKAVELFEQGENSILETSLSVGFRNLSYFHRAFKKRYGMTPHTFITQLAAGNHDL